MYVVYVYVARQTPPFALGGGEQLIWIERAQRERLHTKKLIKFAATSVRKPYVCVRVGVQVFK